MPTIVFLATAWGPKAGGINSFNMDIARALAKAIGPRGQVVCVVPKGAPNDSLSPEKHFYNADGVTIVPLGLDRDDAFDPGWAGTAWTRLQRAGILSVDWWIGHDVVSGEAANRARDDSNQGRSAVIMHMSYRDYQGYKHGSAKQAQQKHEKQRKVLEQANQVLAVGPLLQSRALEVTDNVRMLIPGLPDIPPVRPVRDRIAAISFGRLDPENDRIKQVSLAVAGFAAACRRARATPGSTRLLAGNDPSLTLLGVANENEEKKLQKLAQERGGRVVRIHALPYEEDRGKLLQHVAESNLALMLSWHEGFGLTGWEAIAAEVPLITTTDSGLFKFLNDEGLRSGVHPISIDGALPDSDEDDEPPFTDADQERVAQQILDVAAEIDNHRKSAQELKKSLVAKGCSWWKAATDLLEALGLPPDGGTSPYEPAPVGGVGPTVAGAAGGSPVNVIGAGATSPAPVESILESGELHLEEGREYPDSRLLRAEYQVVPFHEARESLVLDLAKWAEATAPALSIQLRIGGGGAGKTRLGIELCRRLRDKGWEAGFVPEGILSAQIGKVFTRSRQSVAIIDYAETRRSDVFAVVRAALAMPVGHRARVLLLARAGGDWWTHLPDATKDKQVAAMLASPMHAMGPFHVPSLMVTDNQRARVFAQALGAFATKLDKDAGAVVDPPFEAEHFSDPLYLHIAALCALRGERPESARGLLDATVHRERSYWKRAAEEAGMPAERLIGIEQAAALLTLAGGTDNARDTRALLAATPRLEGLNTTQRDGVMDLLRGLYPRKGGVEGLHPDLLGERLVFWALEHDDDLLDVALGRGPETRSRTAFTVLTRSARHGTEEAKWLRRGLEGTRLVTHAKVVLEVAVEEGNPLPEAMAETLAAAPAHVQRRMVPALRQYMPTETVVLQGIALLVAEKWFHFQALKDTGASRGKLAGLTDAQLAFATRLWKAGQLEQARKEYEESLKRRRQLKDEANTAITLGNLANVLGDLGFNAPALQRAREALTIWEKLVKLDDSQHRAQWIDALGCMATCLAESGAHDEALSYSRSVEEKYRLLAEKFPESYRLDWARSLTNLAGDLTYAAEYDEAGGYARKAEEIYRQLAETRPDAYGADWARLLNNIAIHLDDMGQYDEALSYAREAEKNARQLAESRPDAYRITWARSLEKLASALARTDKYDAALPHARTSEEIWRDFAQLRPDAHRSDWARSLANLAEMLLHTDQTADAALKAHEAVGMFGELARQRPHPHRLREGQSRTLLAEALSAQGKHEEAHAEAQAALTCLEQAPPHRSTIESIARVLEILARALEALGRRDDAIAALNRAAALLEPEYVKRPKALERTMKKVRETQGRFTS